MKKLWRGQYYHFLLISGWFQVYCLLDCERVFDKIVEKMLKSDGKHVARMYLTKFRKGM
jgi:hypothetical protein